MIDQKDRRSVDKEAIHALICAGILRPGESPSPDLRTYVRLLMDDCPNLDELFDELLPRWPVEILTSEPNEELTLP